MEKFYHVVNRSIEHKKIFVDKQDHLRFIHDLYILNDKNVVNTTYYFQNKNLDFQENQINKRPRELLVKIHAFCLMPNHYHLFLSHLIENAIPKFAQKLGVAYVKYFNQKYQRRGTLFEGKYKAVSIDNEGHFSYLPFYIHFNPLDLVCPEWREGKLYDLQKALQFLRDYRWSSHLDYSGEHNFPSVIDRKFFLEILGGEEKYKQDNQAWLKGLQQGKRDIGKIIDAVTVTNSKSQKSINELGVR